MSSIKQDSERIEVFEAIFSLTAIEALMESSKKIQTDFDADRKVVFFFGRRLIFENTLVHFLNEIFLIE